MASKGFNLYQHDLSLVTSHFLLIASLVALFLGLGVPKAFSLLYLGLFGTFWLTGRDPWRVPPWRLWIAMGGCGVLAPGR